jgi:hypothetical protein
VDAEPPPVEAERRLPRPVKASSLRQRLAPALLLLGIAAVSTYLSKKAPRESEVTFRLDGDRESLRRLEVTFTRPGEEPAAGSQWTFVAGAPLTIQTKVSLPVATYDVAVTIDARDGRREISHRNAELSGNAATLPVRVVWTPSSTTPSGP